MHAPNNRRDYVGIAFQLVILGAFVAITAWGGLLIAKEPGRIASIWLPNGAVLAYLLFRKRRRWPKYVAVGFIANLFADLVSGDSIFPALLFSSCNSFEVLVAASLLKYANGDDFNLERPRTFALFAFCGLLIAPLLSATFALCYLSTLNNKELYSKFLFWFLADSLGLAIVTPVFLAFLRRDFLPLFTKIRRTSTFGGLTVSLFVTGVVFYQSNYPFLFFIPPVLILVASRGGFSNVVLGIPFLSFIALYATIIGHGPFMLSRGTSPSERLILAQVFVLCNFIMLAFIANLASERRLAIHKLSQLATQDGLTGIANRRFFNDTLSMEWVRALRSKQPISLLLLDIDNFKAFNDTYGHTEGDKCLTKVAQRVANLTTRPGFLAARYGGEELAMILSECPQSDALLFAEHIRESIASLKIPHKANKSSVKVVTASVGVATLYPATLSPSVEPGMLIEKADQSLYEAKRTGRNKVVCLDYLAAGMSNIKELDSSHRLSTVENYNKLAEHHSEELDMIAYLAASILKTPIGLVSLVGKDDQVFVGRYGLDVSGTARDLSFCAHTLDGNVPLVVPDATADPRFSNNALVTGGLGIRFYVGAPLITSHDGTHLGALCVIDQQVKTGMNDEQSKLLMTLANLAVKCMEKEMQVSDKASLVAN